MASGQLNLPPPPPLEIHDANAFEKWKKFELAWTNYALATELTEKPEEVQVATLLTVIGEEAREVFPTFTVKRAPRSSTCFINEMMIQFYKVKRGTDALSNKTSRTESDRKEQTYNKAKSVLGLDVAKHASKTAWPTKTGQRSYRAIVNMASGSPFIPPVRGSKGGGLSGPTALSLVRIV